MRSLAWALIGSLQAATFSFETFPPREVAVVILASLTVIGILALRVVELSILSRFFVLLYSLPFAATIGYLFDANFIWTRAPNVQPLCLIPEIINVMLSIPTLPLALVISAFVEIRLLLLVLIVFMDNGQRRIPVTIVLDEAPPDGKLYIPVGANCNICELNPGIHGNIRRYDADGSNMEIIARGVRNTVGFAWHPETKELWFTDNGRDLMGDDVPDDELNHITQPNLHFGYPFCHAGNIPDPEFGAGHPCSNYVPPAAKLGAPPRSKMMSAAGGDSLAHPPGTPDCREGRLAHSIS